MASRDAQEGIPSINADPAQVAQDDYAQMGQGATVGAGAGAAFGAFSVVPHPG